MHRARQIAALAEAAGLVVKLGTMPELGVATLAAAHLAAALPHATVPADLVGPLLVTEDPLAGAVFAPAAHTGHVDLPTTAGLGPHAWGVSYGSGWVNGGPPTPSGRRGRGLVPWIARRRMGVLPHGYAW
ncbi:enolase C-terminal domain-like protein, partial [Streptomyces sp. NPDC048057]|uniref:enolase C-terminal domain-like protein n=1 Tax=Streptomyces sp. NPDC048057 TaxID=3155628 RepID=UPI0033F312E4